MDIKDIEKLILSNSKPEEKEKKDSSVKNSQNTVSNEDKSVINEEQKQKEETEPNNYSKEFLEMFPDK